MWLYWLDFTCIESKIIYFVEYSAIWIYRGGSLLSPAWILRLKNLPLMSNVVSTNFPHDLKFHGESWKVFPEVESFCKVKRYTFFNYFMFIPTPLSMQASNLIFSISWVIMKACFMSQYIVLCSNLMRHVVQFLHISKKAKGSM